MNLRILKRIGQGSFCTVYEVKKGVFSDACAVKTVRPDLTDQERRYAVGCLDNEVAVLGSLEHDNIINILHVFPFHGTDVLIMPLASEDLLQYFRKLLWQRMSAGDLWQLIRDVSAGVSYIHEQGVIHRDIKCANILLVNRTWKISDFGFAIKQEDEDALRAGTTDYWAPEVFFSARYSTGSDCWAMGKVFMKACVYPLNTVDYPVACAGNKHRAHGTYQDFERACCNIAFKQGRFCVPVFNYHRLNQEVDKYCGGFDQVFDNDGRSINVARLRCLPDFHVRCLVYVLGLLRENPADRMTAREMSDYMTAESVEKSV